MKCPRLFVAETSETRKDESFSLPACCGDDAIFNRRCATCHQRIFPEGERYLIAQSVLFHVTCFRCSICSTCCDVTNYCYVSEHEKFYCLRHYHEMVAAGNAIGDERRVVHGTGPGAFAGTTFCCFESGVQRRKRLGRCTYFLPLKNQVWCSVSCERVSPS